MKSEESGRTFVRWEQEECPLYKLRPKSTRERDTEKARLGGLLIAKINRMSQGRRR